MTRHSYALTLADLIEGPYPILVGKQAAAELRRLHEIEKLFLAYKLEQEAAKEQS